MHLSLSGKAVYLAFLCPRHCFFPRPQSLPPLWHFSLIYLFIFSIPSRFLSIQFTSQFYLFILSRPVSCLCACHRKGPRITRLDSSNCFPTDALVPRSVPLSDPLGHTDQCMRSFICFTLLSLPSFSKARSISGKESNFFPWFKGPFTSSPSSLSSSNVSLLLLTQSSCFLQAHPLRMLLSQLCHPPLSQTHQAASQQPCAWAFFHLSGTTIGNSKKRFKF